MDIHILLSGQHIGPFSEKQVRQYIEEGLVSLNDPARVEGTEAWQPVETLLANLPAAAPTESTPAAESLPAKEISRPAEPAAEPAPAKETTDQSVMQPLAPLRIAASKKQKTGKTALTLEPLRPTTALPPVSAFAPKPRTVIKPLPKLGQLTLNDIPGKIEVPAPAAQPIPEPVASVTSSPSSAEHDEADRKAPFPGVFKIVVYACCGLFLVFIGLMYHFLHLVSPHSEKSPLKTGAGTSAADLATPAEVRKPDAKPQTSADYSMRGMKRQSAGDWDGAFSDFDQAIALDPKSAQAYYRRALARQAKNILNGALDDYNTVLGLDPKNAEAYSNRAYIKQTQGDDDGALADYNQTVLLNPKSAIAFYNVGLIKVKKSDLDGAIVAYNAAIEADPKMSVAYYNRGNAKDAEGNLDGALADYTQAILLDPKLAMAYAYRGLARQTKGDADGALSDYAAALSINPKLGIVYYNRGLVRVQKGDLDGAIDDGTYAIDLDAKNGRAYCNRALARMAKGNLEGATADLKKFCELSPRDTGTDSARLYLWLAAMQLNPKGTADQDLTAALSNDWNSAPEEYVSKIAAFLLGHIQETELIANAASPDIAREPSQYCKGWYFAGMKRLLAGDTKTAITYFQRSVATDQTDYCEYIFSRAELQALGQSMDAVPKASAAQ